MHIEECFSAQQQPCLRVRIDNIHPYNTIVKVQATCVPEPSLHKLSKILLKSCLSGLHKFDHVPKRH